MTITETPLKSTTTRRVRGDKPSAPRGPKRRPLGKKKPSDGDSKRGKTGKSLRNVDRKWWQYELTPKKVKQEELMNFSRQASSYVAAGIPILDALQNIGSESNNKMMKKVLLDIHAKVVAGAPLAVAFSAHADVLPEYYVHMLQGAELTGQLDTTLARLAHYLERDIESRRKIKSALTYPCIIGIMSIVTVIVLAGFVLPKFKDFFESLGAKLPLATRILLATTGALTTFWYVPAALFVLFVALIIMSTRVETLHRIRDRMLLKAPGIGNLLRYLIVERFCRVMAAMVQAGVPLPDALIVGGAATNNRTFQLALHDARDQMMRGDGLSGPIKATGLFPSAANQMLRVGETTGTLDQQLESASTFFEKELDYRLKRFTDMFEPVMIIFVGLIVGFVAVSLVAAMYGIYNQVDI
jgi:type IV pilus assembly protein PilC